MSDSASKRSSYWKGKKFSLEYRQKLSDAHKGHIPWNKGKTLELSEDQREAIRNRMRGDKSPWWKGGITRLGKRIRQLLEYKQWRIAVYLNHNSECAVCGCQQHIGHAHHIRPFYKILSEFLYTYREYDPVKDVAILEKLAMHFGPFWDVNNGVVLCPSCHSSIKH